MSRASCIICDEHGDVLVLFAGGWEIPGGDVAAGQSPEEAAKRAVKDELGVDIAIIRTLGARQNDTWFLAEIMTGEPALLTSRATKFGFFSLVTLTRRYDELAPSTKEFLEAMAYGEIDLAV